MTGTGVKGNGQDPGNLLGKALRINVSDTSLRNPAYAIPLDNPYINDGRFKDEIWAWGLRNPWRCARDKQTDRIFCGDVGQNAFEEVDIVARGKNYGWRGAEGFQCYDSSLCTKGAGEWELPIHAYPHSSGKSITGGFVYRGCLYPKLQGKYILGDYVSGRMWALTEPPQSSSASRWEAQELRWGDTTECTGKLTGDISRRILSFGQDRSGELCVMLACTLGILIGERRRR